MKTMSGQLGLSLIELMISVLLAAIISTASIAMLMSDSQTSRFQIGQAATHNSGRFAFDFILDDLRKAGYSDSAAIANPVDGMNSLVASESDQLSISYESTLSGGRDCVGNPMPGVVINTYKIKLEDDGEHVLECNKKPLMYGVDGFQVLFGINPSGGDVPTTYVPPGSQAASDRIVTVKIAMLVSTKEEVGVHVAHSYQLLDVNTGPLADGKGRTLFTTTERIRNNNLDVVL